MKLYPCPYHCGAMLPHDKLHNHVMHQCRKRPVRAKQESRCGA